LTEERSIRRSIEAPAEIVVERETIRGFKSKPVDWIDELMNDELMNEEDP